MLDIKLIRTETDRIKKALARRKEEVDIDGLLELDNKRRELLFDVEQKKAQQNVVSKQIPQFKKEGKDTTEIFAQMKELSDSIKADDEKVRELDEKIQTIMYTIPNIPNETVPDGDTDEDNVEIRKFMEPTKFDFEPKAHWDIGKDLGILDPESAAKITGARFHIYKKGGARLERAIMNYYLDTHTSRGYDEIFPPFMVHRNSMLGTGQLPKLNVFGNDYPTKDGTGVRDYIHVVDLAKGHVKAIQKLEKCPDIGVKAYNLGTGIGYSVLDVIENFSKACGKQIPYEITERRPGDIAECYANASLAKEELGWEAEYGIKEMCEDTWNWQKKNPNGYKGV